MFANAERASGRFGGSLKKLGGTLMKAVGTYATMNLNSVVSFMTAGARGAMELSDTMAKMSTSVDTSVYSMKGLEKQLKKVANENGFAVNELAKIQMDAIGTGGIDPGASAEFAGVLAKTAKIAGTDAHTAMGDLTSVMGAFNMEAGQGAKIAGQMLLVTQKLGRNITFETMRKGMKSVMPQAAALNISTGEMFSSFAVLTSMGEDSAKAMKSVGSAFEKIARPSKEASAAAKALGIDFSAAAVKSKGFAGFIDDIAKKTGGNTKALETLFGDVNIARMMRKLGVEGATAFKDAISQMDGGAAALDEFFKKATDSPAERWKKAMNRITNAGVSIGAAFIPVIEKIAEKISGVADKINGMDFEKFSSAMGKVGAFIGFLIDRIVGVIQFAWNFRGVIIAVLAPLALLSSALGAIGLGLKIISAWQVAAKIWTVLTTSAFNFQTLALGGMKAGTASYLIASKAFEISTILKNKLLNTLTGGTLMNTAATASHAVMMGTATAAQWSLNAAMAANPIGFIITLIALLVAGIVLLVKNLDYVKAAFQSLGDIITLAILTPIQMLLELLALIPGMKDKMDIQGLRDTTGIFSDKGATHNISDRFGKVGENRKLKEKEKQQAELNEMMRGMEIPGMEALDMSNFNMPEFDMPDFNMPDFSGASGTTAGKSKLHGVVDIASGAASVPAIGGEPVTRTATSGASDAASGASGTALIAATVTGIAALIRNIDGNVTAIADRCTRTITDAVSGPWLAGNAPRLASPPLPRIYSGNDEDDATGANGARNIAPVTQGERMAYSLQERRETLAIEVQAAKGSEARIVRAPIGMDIELTSSGGMA
jgi:TP901 family phage tail tape measure protein